VGCQPATVSSSLVWEVHLPARLLLAFGCRLGLSSPRVFPAWLPMCLLPGPYPERPLPWVQPSCRQLLSYRSIKGDFGWPIVLVFTLLIGDKESAKLFAIPFLL